MTSQRILLLSCYELGHQPLNLAWPLAFLKEAGFEVKAIDLAVDQLLPTVDVTKASFIGISTPMHTALRLGVEAAKRARELNPQAHICFYGSYAWLNADFLLGTDRTSDFAIADSVIAGEAETIMVKLVKTLVLGEDISSLKGVSTKHRRGQPNLSRLRFPRPIRTDLPRLDRYGHFVENGRQVIAGYTEASRGCLHTCLHCPIVPIYDGRFFVVPIDTVLADIKQQVEAGARHITFGDPDFLNGPGHSMKIVRTMHDHFPEITFDFTAKVEHILDKRDYIAELSELGAAFMVSAFESTSDIVLKNLEKGHSAADLDEALDILASASLAIQPTWVPFTPWTTLEDFLAMLAWIRKQELIPYVPAVQYSIRLLIPPGSRLFQRNRSKDWLGALDAPNYSYCWHHPDFRMDALQSLVVQIVQQFSDDNWRAFEAVENVAYEIAGEVVPEMMPIARKAPSVPRLTEDWFC